MSQGKVSLIPLGGMSAVGARNSYALVYEIDGKRYALLLDYGSTPHDNSIVDFNSVLPDEYFPDITPLLYRNIQVAGVLCSHGHFDHIKGVPDFLERYGQAHPDWKMPVIYASSFTRSVLGKIVYQLPSELLPEMESLVWKKPKDQFERIVPFEVCTFPVIHSIPGASGFSIKVGGKHILYLGDFKLHGDPGEEKDLQSAIEDITRESVDLLLLDSTNAQQEGFTLPERAVLDQIKRVMEEKRGGRLAFTTSSPNLKRLRFIIKTAGEQGRFVFVLGVSLERYLQAGGVNGGWRPYRWGGEDGRYPDVPANAIFLVTGCQAEEGSGIWKILNGEVPLPWDPQRDSIVVAANTSFRPEAQERVREMVGRAHEICETLFLAYGVAADKEYDNVERGLFHVSGHANNGDLEEIVKLVNPSLVVPIHGHIERRREVGSIVPKDISFQLVEEGEVFDV